MIHKAGIIIEGKPPPPLPFPHPPLNNRQNGKLAGDTKSVSTEAELSPHSGWENQRPGLLRHL